jgi:DNA-binding LacI/PurR family transcriptional regulator
MPRITLQSIADEVGVSRMTVSNAFSRPDQLSQALRTRILDVAQRLGYAGPDPSARSLARGRTGVVGVLWPGALEAALADAGTALFLGALADESLRHGLSLTLLPGCADGPTDAAREVAMDAVVVYAADSELPDLEWLRRRQLPMFAVGGPGANPVIVARAVVAAVKDELARPREAQVGALRRITAPDRDPAPVFV